MCRDVARGWSDLWQPLGHVLLTSAVCHDHASLACPRNERGDRRQHLVFAFRLRVADGFNEIEYEQSRRRGVKRNANRIWQRRHLQRQQRISDPMALLLAGVSRPLGCAWVQPHRARTRPVVRKKVRNSVMLESPQWPRARDCCDNAGIECDAAYHVALSVGHIERTAPMGQSLRTRELARRAGPPSPG
jgi:hypothetical protein